MIIVDTSIIVAYMNSTDDHHAQVSEWLDSEQDDLATTPLVIAEVDHLIVARGGPVAASALRADLLAGAYLVEWWAGAIATSVRVAEQYADNGVGLTDASLVALGDHIGSTDIATLDERHFRAVRPLAGGDTFRLLPHDR